jgi:hypothetical protein
MQWPKLPLVGALLFCACNPYQNFSGEFYAGTVDAVGFAKPYLGTGGDPKMGGGIVNAIPVFVANNPVNYYFFPATDGVVATDLSGSASLAYVFDPDPGKNAFTTPKCQAPANYVYDLRTDPYALNQQGVIFTDLPDDPTYVPVVAEVPVTSAGEPCQQIKSEATLVTSTDVSLPLDSMGKHGKPDGNYLAFATVDPRVDFAPDALNDPATFFGPTQQWGWFGRFLSTFIDGGYIPFTTDSMGNDVATTQKIYVVDATDSAGMPVMGADPMGQPGSGLDVAEHARGETGYSPICEVVTYTATSAADLPTTAADVATKGTIDPVDPMAGPTYVYCLGVKP